MFFHVAVVETLQSIEYLETRNKNLVRKLVLLTTSLLYSIENTWKDFS